MCPVNGIRDLVQWRTGRDWTNEFVWGLGQGGGFAYLRFNAAHPPRQVYTGIATPRQHRYLAELLGMDLKVVENRAFKFAWGLAQAALDQGKPPILGPLDMFHLPYYSELYHRRHIPIHFVLLVGYDRETAYLHDTGEEAVQAVPLAELQRAWDVNSPGLGKRNRLTILEIPNELPPDAALIRKSVADECRMMLHPPVSMVGIPAMKKLAREIVHWPVALGDEAAAHCLLQVREYLNMPPDLEGNHLTAGRDVYIEFLKEAGEMSGLDFSPAVRWLGTSMAAVPDLAGAIRRADLEQAAAGFEHMAEWETAAFREMARVVGVESEF